MVLVNRKSVGKWLLTHPYFNPYGFTMHRFYRTLTSFCRVLPDYIIAGNNRSGTASLHKFLIQHPNITAPSRREIGFFSHSYWRGLLWYRSYFSTIIHKRFFEYVHKEPLITGDDSPMYLFHPTAIHRIKKVLPNVKLIIILRNPVDHAYSLYQYYRRTGMEKVSFEDAIKEDEKRAKILEEKLVKNEIREHNRKFFRLPYIHMGKYIYDIKRLFEIFPRKQILILSTEMLKTNPQDVLDQTFEFLGLKYYKIKNLESTNVASYVPINAATRDFLINFFKPYNAELEKFLDKKFNWGD